MKGSGYGDDIDAGSGINYVDGGANAGSPPWGGKAQDVLHVRVANQAEAGAVHADLLSEASTGADAAAYAGGYTHKVVNGASVSYVKGIERISVQVVDGGQYTWARDIALAIVVHESAQPATSYHVAWASGTDGADTIDMSGATQLLTEAAHTAMDTYKSGVWIDGGAGNDTITGTAYGDNFRNGAGSAKIDGGANGAPDGEKARDVFEIEAASAADMSAIQVVVSDDPGYEWMVTYGNSSQKDYLKNVEAVVISVPGGAGKWIPLVLEVHEIAAGANLESSHHFAWANGTDRGDTFNAAADVSAATLALMQQHGRGMWIATGAGNDTVTGTGFGDDIDAGSGTNHVDGGANAGSPPWGDAARDTLRVHVSTTAQADAVQVSALTGTLSGADAAASTAGYTHKVVNGSDVSYIKGIETVSVIVTDANSSVTARQILLSVLVREANPSDANLADYSHLAWVNGTAAGDTIDMSGDTSLLTAGIKSAMATHQAGVWIDGGAGNDTITGTAYGDYIRNGAGNALLDGGANAGGKDIFHISVATTEELAAVQVAASDDPAYQWMVAYGAGGQKDYLKNVEAVTISVTGSGSSKMIPLVLTVDEIAANANLASSMHFAWAQGTSKGDQFSVTADVSDATQALMAQHGRGVYVDTGAGNDTITGSAYGDNIVAGAGTNYIDGGANGGSTPAGGAASDTLDMYVANAAAAAAVSVTTLSETAGDEADRAAFAAGYRFKVANGTVEVNYVKGIERVNVFVWNDKDGDGVRDYAGTDPSNEVTFGRQIALTETALPAANSVPTFSGVPRGVLAIDAGSSLLMSSSTALANGKVLGIALHVNADSGYRVQSMVLTRTAADGSIDTTFGNGTGMVRLTVPYNTSGGPLVQADGKLVLAVRTISNSADVRLVRLNEDGSVDASFGSGGQAILSTAGSDMSRKLLLQSDGKIVVVATASGSVENGLTVYRLDANGVVDSSYGSAGKFSSAFLAGDVVAQAAMQADGRVVVVSKTPGAGGAMAAVRVSQDGTLDASFGSGGTVELIPGVAGSAAAVALQGDGKILVGGSVAGAGSDVDMALVRLNANGTLDTSFAQGGKLVTPIGVTSESIAHLLVQADGKILALANVNRDPSTAAGAKIVLFRFNADGSADTSFGHQGASTLSLHGIADFGSGLMLVGDKIIVTGYSNNDTGIQATTSIVARFTADGKLDPSFAATQGSSLGGTLSTTGVAPQSLDPNASIYDAELVARGHYAGASLTVARAGGANAEDIFTGVGNVSFAGGKVSVGGVDIGTVTQGAGSLAITFNDKATQGLVNLALHGVGYSNSSSAPPASVSVAWTFSDGNDGSQGTGGAQQATGTTVVRIGIVVSENSQNPNSVSGRAMTGAPMADVAFWGDVRGTNAGDSFDAATGFSAGVTALMNQYQRGAYFDMGNGNDTVAGTAYSDQFQMGAGVDYIDGRAHQGTHPWEGAGLDELRVLAPNEAAADAVRVTLLAGATGAADQAALAAGYEAKVVSGTAVTYIKNVERVTIFTWTDSDGDGVRGPSEPLTWSRPVDLAVKVNEVRISSTDPTKDASGNPLSGSYHFAWVESSLRNDSFNAATDVSAATQALMAQYGRGVSVNTGSGNDTVTGSAYGDNISTGSGINYVDGGANGGATPGNHRAVDVLEIFVASEAAAAAVSVSLLENGSADTRDAAAFAAGYTHKVVNGANVDYVKNIERVVIHKWTDADANDHREWNETQRVRDIPLAMRVDEVQVSATNPAQDSNGNLLESNYHFAWAQGTGFDDEFNAASDVSAPTRALMDQYQRGVYVNLGAGNDIIVGSAYGDQFEPGAGVNYIDGGANSGANPDGNRAKDLMSMWVGSKAESDALVVQRLAAGTGSAADQAAFASGYVFKVASGTGQVNYVKDVEELHVHIWEDKDGDSVRDYGTSQDDPNNEVTFGRYEQLILNSAPTFAGAPAGVAVTDGGIDFGLAGGATTLPDGKVLTLSYLAEAPAGMPIYGTMLTRSNADGSIDTSFGNGGMIQVSVYFPASAPPAVQADGKILIAFDSGPTAAGDVHLIRLNPDGSEDASFGANGHAYIAASAGRDFPRKVLVQADGKIVVVSFSGGTDGMLPEYTAFRVNSNGTLDTSYGNAGKLAVTFAANGGTPATAILQPDGKLLMVGSAKLADNLDFAAVRVNTDGSLDASFGDGGKLVLPIGTGSDSASPVAVLSDGKILVAGHSRSSADPASDWDAAIVRLNANGTLDTSFGLGGKVVMAMPEHQQIYGMQVQPDGKFLALVLMTPVGPNSMGREVAVVRFNANGSVDTSFGDEGATTLQLHGITDSAFSLMLVNGKIIVAGSTTNDTEYNTSGFLARLNADGSPDATFGGHVSSLGGSVRTNGTTPVALDKNASVYDAEMAAFGHYGGAMLTVQRQGGANAEDKFTGIGEVSFSDNNIVVGGVLVGNSDTSGGSLKLWFNGNATQGLVNRVLHGIGYSNSSETPPSTVTISWSFSDGNSHGGQGQGGELTDTGTTTVQIGTIVTEYVVNPQNPARAVNGWLLTNIQFFADVSGTAGGDSFDANSLSAAVKTLMSQYERGVRVELGGGNDTFAGSGYSDEIAMGSGIDYVDGRAHAGSLPWDRIGRDELRVHVADEAAADAVRVSQLSAASTGEDLAAFNLGYEAKVVNGVAVTYVKNVELVTIFKWNDSDGDGVRDGSETVWLRQVPLALKVHEVQVSATDPAADVGGQPLSSYMHMAWAEGSLRNDSFNASTDVSAATRAVMDQYGRGLFVDTGAGNDTVTGSAYGDNIISGTGINYVDGGANGGSAPGNSKAADALEIYVASAAEAAAVSVSALAGGSADARDAAAFAAGYTHKVINGENVDYVKNIERIVIFKWTDADNNGVRDGGEVAWLRDIPLALRVDEIQVSATDPTRNQDGVPLVDNLHFAWAWGASSHDNFSAKTDISAATQQLMVAYNRGVYAVMGDGNDTVTGSAYGDDIDAGAGINYVDGGANVGTNQYGAALDTLHMTVATQAESDGLVIEGISVASADAADRAAFADGYLFKVVNGDKSTTYLKNVERVAVDIWNDKDGDGQRDYGSSQNDPANEVTSGRYLTLNANTAPTFSGASPGIALQDAGSDFGPIQGTVLPDGKLLTVSYINHSFHGNLYQYVLTRVNADGSADTSFGNGTGRVVIGEPLNTTAKPVIQADGKILFAGAVPAQLGGHDFHVWRYHADGSLDTSFGNGGVKIIDFSGTDDLPLAIALQGDKIVVVGNSYDATTNNSFAATRLNPDGSLDTSFASGGKFTSSLTPGSDSAFAVGVQADGKLVLGGRAGGQMAAVRLNADGTPDTSFGTAGTVLLPTTVNSGAFSLTFADGRILLAGDSGNNNANVAAAMVRLLADGALDPSFGSGGTLTAQLSPADDRFRAVEVQQDGKIVVAAYASLRSPTDPLKIVILRFHPDGSPDTQFGQHGRTVLQMHGVADQLAGMSLVGGKIVVYGTTVNDTNYNTTGFIARLNSDGSMDASFGPNQPDSLGGTVVANGIQWQALDLNAAVYDAEMAARGHYGGAEVRIERQGGVNPEDVFSGVGEVSLANGVITVGGKEIGTANVQDGFVQITFSDQATQGLVNRALHGIGYANLSLNPQPSIVLEWTFSDQNLPNGSWQGNGSGVGTSTTTVQIAATVREVLQGDPGFTSGGQPLNEVAHFAYVRGSVLGDHFDAATGFSPAVRALMDQYKRGASFDMMRGDDVITGTAYSDEIVVGSGINYIDGGDHLGTYPWGGAGRDELRLFVPDRAAAAAVQTSLLSAASTGADLDAFNLGYDIKIANGANINYARNLELVSVYVWNNTDGDGQRDPEEITFSHGISLAPLVHEVNASGAEPLANYWHFAWINGWERADVIDAMTGISAPTLALMSQYKRGAAIKSYGGDDVLSGTPYADEFSAGSGVNRVDGRDDAGTDPNGRQAADVLNVFVSDAAAGNAVAVTLLAAGMSGGDAAAFADGYIYRVQNGDSVTYVKNVENLVVYQWTDTNGNGEIEEAVFLRSVPLALNVHERVANGSDPTRDSDGNLFSGQLHFAWANGTLLADSFNATTQLSAEIMALMNQYQRGMHIELGAGNDTVTGTPYGDHITFGAGVDYIDGGAHGGTRPWDGSPATDVLEIFVPTAAAADEVICTSLTGAMTGDDLAAAEAGYQFKVTYGGAVSYVKGVEEVIVQLWQDKDGDGLRDYGANESDPVNEVSFLKVIGLPPPTTP